MFKKIFNPDFYPTPAEVIERMLEDVKIIGKVFLEPSAGSGNIVDVLRAGIRVVILQSTRV